MGAVQFSGRLPGTQTNGLNDLMEDLFLEEAAPEEVVVVAVVKRKSWGKDDETGDPKALAKVAAIEPLSGEAAETALKLLGAARETRTGQAELALDVDAEADR